MKIQPPLKGSFNITGRFEKRTPIYINGVWTLPFHYGVDWSAPSGTPIYAVADGIVRTTTWDNSGYGGGWRIIIDHSDGWSTHYLHMREQSTLNKGQQVKAGQLVGYVGSTGLSTGAHLHFEQQKNGVAVDPLPHITQSEATQGKSDDMTIYIRRNSQAKVYAYSPLTGAKRGLSTTEWNAIKRAYGAAELKLPLIDVTGAEAKHFGI